MLERDDIEVRDLQPDKLLALARNEPSLLSPEEEQNLSRQLAVPPSPEAMEVEALKSSIVHPRMDVLFDTLEETRFAHIPVTPRSHRDVLGPGIDAAKKTLMKLLKPLVSEVFRRQEAFNTATIEALRELDSATKHNQAELQQLRQTRRR